jgi:hypothetical protein
MFVLHIPTMQLQYEQSTGDKPLIFNTAMSAGAAKQLSVPGAARLDIVNADEGRQFHAVVSYVA